MKKNVIKIRAWASAHKRATITIVVVALAAGGYAAYAFMGDDKTATQYVLSEAARGIVETSVSGTGQVSAGNQKDLTAKASGTIVFLNAKAGQEVKLGQVIAQIDSTDAAYELESARISYDKVVSPDENDVSDAKDAATKARASAQATLASASSELTGTRDDIFDLLNEGYLYDRRYGLSTTGSNYRERAQDGFYEADNMLTDFIREYRTFTGELSSESLYQALADASAVAKSVAQAAKYAEDSVAYLRTRESNGKADADDAYELATSITASANSTVSSLASAASSLKSAEDALSDLVDGPDELELRSETLSLKAKQEAYGDHFVRSPFDGVIASVSAKKGDEAAVGTDIATVITNDKIAEITLNEIDAAKVSEGQKAKLTFDAVDGLEAEGLVSEIDLVGTVSQGVVSYAVKIAFGVTDPRVKPGMTVSATIVTESKPDVISVPSSAVKTVGGKSFVEVIDGAKASRGPVTSSQVPHMVPVELGLTGDESVEVVSGLSEGEAYVSRTISATGAQAASQAAAPSLFGGATRTGGTGGTRTGGQFIQR